MGFNLKRLAEQTAKDEKSSKKDSNGAGGAHEKKDKAPDHESPTKPFGNQGGGEEKREISDDIKMISGPELMDVLKDILPMMDKLQGGVGPLFDQGMDLDFDDAELAPDDMVNDSFKGMGGCGGVVKVIKLDGGNAKEVIQKLIDHLGNVRRSERQILLRKAFADVHNYVRGNVEARAHAVVRIANVMQDATQQEFGLLVDALTLLSKGDSISADGAGYAVKMAYVNTLPETHSVRVAYTTLSTTHGEPVQFCPKAVKQKGYAVAMELSKCRDNCIDSTIDRDGKIGCGYAKWLRVSKDNHEILADRFEIVKHGLNENKLNIAEGERGKKDDAGFEKMLEDAKSRKIGKTPEDSLETELDGVKFYNHKKKEEDTKRPQELNARKAGKAKNIDAESEDNLGVQVEKKGHDPVADDKSLSQMLESEHGGLSEDDLDWLEEQLGSYRDDK